MSTHTIEISAGAPSLSPSAASTGTANATPGTSKPALSASANGLAGASSSVVPSHLPPGAHDATTAAAGGVTGSWTNGQTVNAMWGTNETRNAYMSVVGVGWLKIFNGTDGAFTALTTLASQARQTGHTISYRVEPDGMVHEIYLW